MEVAVFSYGLDLTFCTVGIPIDSLALAMEMWLTQELSVL